MNQIQHILFVLLFLFSFTLSDQSAGEVFSLPCTYTSSTGETYDFSQITKTKDIQTSGKRGVYYAGVCHNTFHACGSIESPVCISQPEPNYGFSSGGTLSSRSFVENDNGDIELHYSDGSQCTTNKSNRKTTLVFRCNPEALEPKVIDLIEGCELSMTIEAAEACPVNDHCITYQSSSTCVADCDCGWCPSEGGMCMGAKQMCYSSMKFGASCVGVSKPGSNSDLNFLKWMIPTVSIAVFGTFIIVSLVIIAGICLGLRLARKIRMARRTRNDQHFELISVDEPLDEETQQQFSRRRELRKQHQKPVDLLLADDESDKPTAPELIDFSGATNVHESMYPQLQPINTAPLQPQPVAMLPQQQVMFYIPVTAQQFSQLPIEQQQAMLYALQQQQAAGFVQHQQQ